MSGPMPSASSPSGTATPPAQTLRGLMKGGSKTFFAASLLLPPRVRGPATALYAFCRIADDLIDLGSDPHAEMRGLQTRLDALYDGRPGPHAADRALAPVVHRHAIPRALFDGLLEGFLWDAEGHRYQTLADVQAYGARVAGTVGAMMALVMGVHTRAALARACELGVAMQLTNIARDVGEDARNGRLYLPRQWLAEEGIDADRWLQAPCFTPAVARVTTRLLQAAEALYQRAEHGVAELPLDCRPAIQAARLVYAEIGHQLEREGLDSVNHRAVVSSRRKLALIAIATGSAYLPTLHRLADEAPLPAVQFLVDAAAAGETRLAERSFDERMAWAADLYARLVEQDRQPQRAGSR
jgi:15-cis-phytoene synthase